MFARQKAVSIYIHYCKATGTDSYEEVCPFRLFIQRPKRTILARAPRLQLLYRQLPITRLQLGLLPEQCYRIPQG